MSDDKWRILKMSDAHLIGSEDSITSVDVGYTFKSIQTVPVTVSITVLTVSLRKWNISSFIHM